MLRRIPFPKIGSEKKQAHLEPKFSAGFGLPSAGFCCFFPTFSSFKRQSSCPFERRSLSKRTKNIEIPRRSSLSCPWEHANLVFMFMLSFLPSFFRRWPDYSSNPCPPKIFAMWLFLGGGSNWRAPNPKTSFLGVGQKVTWKWLQIGQNNPKMTQEWLFESLLSHSLANPRKSLMSHSWVTCFVRGFGRALLLDMPITTLKLAWPNSMHKLALIDSWGARGEPTQGKLTFASILMGTGPCRGQLPGGSHGVNILLVCLPCGILLLPLIQE